jgi:predicted adenylyl cyclase CyaB
MLNIEIKAKTNNPEKAREFLKSRNARFAGVDFQKDTYFKVSNGRLKLREGNIEHALIYYEREPKAEPKQSNIILHKLRDADTLKDILHKIFTVSVVVEKKREIYFIDNVKFHIDEVFPLGNFIEIEAIDEHETIGTDKLRSQCEEYMHALGIAPDDLLTHSYSDMLKGK